jgi:hypothetical protein
MAGEYEPTLQQMQAWAKATVEQRECAEFFRLRKIEYFGQWLNNPTPAQRDVIYAKVHAMADVEMMLKTLADGAAIDARKTEAFRQAGKPIRRSKITI